MFCAKTILYYIIVFKIEKHASKISINVTVTENSKYIMVLTFSYKKLLRNYRHICYYKNSNNSRNNSKYIVHNRTKIYIFSSSNSRSNGGNTFYLDGFKKNLNL